MTSRVEENLRAQRGSWKEISERVFRQTSRELPIDPPRRIILFGIGSSYHAARLSGYSLLRDKSRTRVPVLVCSSLSVGIEVHPQRGDWAFGFTHRGKTEATLKALDRASREGAMTFLVAAQGVKPEIERVDYVLETCSLETVEPHTMAMTGAICAFTTLLLGEKAVEEWDALRSIGDPDLEIYKRRVEASPTIILGEFEAEWIAREGALKLMEMAKIPVRVYGSEEYFHGPRISEKTTDRIWHIAMPEDKRTSQIQASYRIQITGGTPLAWVPALIEFQWLALAVALNNGVDPDQSVGAK